MSVWCRVGECAAARNEPWVTEVGAREGRQRPPSTKREKAKPSKSTTEQTGGCMDNRIVGRMQQRGNKSARSDTNHLN